MNSVGFYKYTNPVQYTSFSLIMAVDNRGAIGFNNDLPWKGLVNNKTDMEWFKEKTKGKIVVMGYNTWVSLGCKPLPGRVNIILTKKHIKEVTENIERFNYAFLNNPANNDKKLPTTFSASSSEDVILAIKNGLGSFHNGGEVMIIGGAQIYQSFMEHASRIYLTTFDGEFEADTFVHLDLKDFDLIYRDKTKYLEPKFEIWDVTEEAAKRADSDIMQIEYIHREPEGIAAEIKKKKEKENGKNV